MRVIGVLFGMLGALLLLALVFQVLVVRRLRQCHHEAWIRLGSPGALVFWSRDLTSLHRALWKEDFGGYGDEVLVKRVLIFRATTYAYMATFCVIVLFMVFYRNA